jgi:hypothetical protein
LSKNKANNCNKILTENVNLRMQYINMEILITEMVASHELHKIAFPNVLHTRLFLILTKKIFLQTLNEAMNLINNCVKISSTLMLLC